METKVYVAHTGILAENKELFDSLYDIVSDYRKNRIDKTRSLKDKALSLGAGVLLKKALYDMGMDDPELNIGFARYDKPILNDHPEIYFNLSHSGEMAMCAVSDKITGCDVEEVCDRNFGIAKKAFAGYEKEVFDSLNDILKPDAFFRIWTMKESFVKATGAGLALGLGSFSVLDKDGELVKYIEHKDDKYYLYPLDMYDGYKYALCLKNADENEKINIIKCDYKEMPWK